MAISGLRPNDSPVVLHLLESGGLYGIERMLLSLLPALRQRGVMAELVCIGAADSPARDIGDAAQALGIRVSYLGFRGRLSVSGLARLSRLLDDRGADVLHLHGYKAAILGGLLARLKRLPAVATYHAEAFRHAQVATYVRLEAPVLRRLDQVVAVSEPIASELRARGVAPARIRVIANGIEDPNTGVDTSTREPNDRRLLVVGRLVDGKNVDLLIDVVSRLHSTDDEVSLVVAGDGPRRDALAERARTCGVSSSVQFLGFTPHLRDTYARGGIFVLPSRTEGMPIALLEAMAHGLPIVATSVGSIPSVVRDGVEGLIVPPDDGEALERAIRHVLSDASLRTAIGARARARFMERYQASAMGAAYSELYAEMLSGRHGELPASA